MLLVDVTHDLVQPYGSATITRAREGRCVVQGLRNRQLVRLGCLHYSCESGFRESVASALCSAAPRVGGQIAALQSRGSVGGGVVDVGLHDLGFGYSTILLCYVRSCENVSHAWPPS